MFQSESSLSLDPPLKPRRVWRSGGIEVKEKIWSLNTSGGSEVLISRLGRVLPFQRTLTGIVVVVVSSFGIVMCFGEYDG